MNNIQHNLQILKAKQFTYPYVVAAGRECATSRGDILLFQTLAAAIVCRDEMNRCEQMYRLRAKWEVKRLDLADITHSVVFYEELLEKGTLETRRDVSKNPRGLKWRRV